MNAQVHTEAMTATQRASITKPLTYPRQLEIPTMELWEALGTIWETERGEENRYFVDQFGNEFFCKCLEGWDDYVLSKYPLPVAPTAFPFDMDTMFPEWGEG